MEALWATDSVEEAGNLEIKLIRHYKQLETDGRLRNKRDGKDNPPKYPPTFVYAVFGTGPPGGGPAAQAYALDREKRVGPLQKRRRVS